MSQRHRALSQAFFICPPGAPGIGNPCGLRRPPTPWCVSGNLRVRCECNKRHACDTLNEENTPPSSTLTDSRHIAPDHSDRGHKATACIRRPRRLRHTAAADAPQPGPTALRDGGRPRFDSACTTAIPCLPVTCNHPHAQPGSDGIARRDYADERAKTPPGLTRSKTSRKRIKTPAYTSSSTTSKTTMTHLPTCSKHPRPCKRSACMIALEACNA